MDREAWQATGHGVTRVGHALVTKPPCMYAFFFLAFRFYREGSYQNNVKML